MNNSVINLTDGQLHDIQVLYNPVQGQQVLTMADMLDQLSSQFLFKTGLMAFSFMFVMAYLQLYTTSIQKEAKRDSEGNKIMKNRDRILCFIADVFFLASLAYSLIFVGYYTGWFT